MHEPPIRCEAEVLGRLLAVHGMLSAFPSALRMGEFARKAVEDLAAVAHCGLCIPGGGRPRLGNFEPAHCLPCGRYQPGAGEDLQPCALPADEARALPMQTSDQHYGFLLLDVADAERFAPYEPFIRNLASNLALELERRQQREQVEQANLELRRFRDRLQQLVDERTSELLQAHRRVEHLNAVLRGIRGVNRIIVRARDAAGLASSACGILIEARGYRHAWIALVEPSGELTVQGGAGFLDHDLETLRNISGLSTFPCITLPLSQPGVAVMSCRLDCCPAATYVAELAVVAVRLAYQGQVFGVLVVSAEPQYATDTEEQALLHDVADDIGRALHGFEQGSRRERAELALEETQEIYRTLVDTSPDAIVLEDDQGVIRMCNPRAVEMLGCAAPGDVVGTLLADWVVDEDRPRATEHVTSMLATGRAATGEWSFRRKDGRRLVGQISAAVIRDAQGPPWRLMTTIRDVTRPRRLEAQLHAAQRMESVGRLAGGVAHDFNNLLTVITSFGGFVLESLDERDPVREDAQQIMEAAESASSLTRQLLAFARRQVMQPSVVELDAVVAGLEKMLRRLIGEDIELVTVLPPDLGMIRADVAQIEQVFMNLAVNARDAMPRGGKLTIETANVALDAGYSDLHAGTHPGQYVMLALSDTGTGMTEDVKARIFEPFFSTKGEGKGTGLGLSTVYGIVKQNGGEVWVYSEPGHGSTFKIYWPRADQDSRAVSHRTQRQTGPSGHETVLVVEDDAAVLRATVRMLKKAGYAVLHASSGGDALLILEQRAGPVDVVITDVVMPVMSGFDLAQRLRALRPELPIIYMSGYTDNAIVNHGALDEGALFLEKPFAEAKLLAMVRRALDVAPDKELP